MSFINKILDAFKMEAQNILSMWKSIPFCAVLWYNVENCKILGG